jgi:hypothetical protein
LALHFEVVDRKIAREAAPGLDRPKKRMPLTVEDRFDQFGCSKSCL